MKNSIPRLDYRRLYPAQDDFMNKLIPSLLSIVLFAGCTNQQAGTTADESPMTRSDETVALQEIRGDWSKRIGTKVVVTGKAVNHKIGAYLLTNKGGIYIDLPETHWPNELYFGGDNGETVTVTGTVVERNDLPVFIPNPNEPQIQGIPVSEGTDLEKASKRFVLESVEWNKTKDAE